MNISGIGLMLHNGAGYAYPNNDPGSLAEQSYEKYLNIWETTMYRLKTKVNGKWYTFGIYENIQDLAKAAYQVGMYMDIEDIRATEEK